jgi:hypothetical protein
MPKLLKNMEDHMPYWWVGFAVTLVLLALITWGALYTWAAVKNAGDREHQEKLERIAQCRYATSPDLCLERER